MKTLTLLAMLMSASTMAIAQPVYLNIPAEAGSPAMTIPTASQQTCEQLMMKLSRTDESNFYLSCSIVPMTAGH